jgi:hypothetical protein
MEDSLRPELLQALIEIRRSPFGVHHTKRLPLFGYSACERIEGRFSKYESLNTPEALIQ